MTINGDGTHSLVELVFRQQHEEVLACESVVVIARGTSNKGAKSRMLALCRPFTSPAVVASSSTITSSSSKATLGVVRVEPGREIKVKLVFVVARLLEVTHDGSFDATFNFGSSGMLSVSFESHIQREMFVAAVRKVQRDMQPLLLSAPRGVHALLTDSLGAEVEADAAARVKSLRQAKRRALTAEDEQQLQQFLGRHSFDDIRSTERLLLTRQKEAELSSVEVLITSVDAWSAVRSRIADLVDDVERLEGRISKYSRHILSKKDQLQRIEHQSNMLQRKQRNLRRLQEEIEAFHNQLSLPPQATTLLLRLSNTLNKDLVEFFSEGNNAQVLSEAMKHMRDMLQSVKLEGDYPIAAFSERRAFYKEQRHMVASRSKAYIFAVISKHETAYLADQTRYSGKGRLVWRLHLELVAQLASFQNLIMAMAHVDIEGFIAVLRRYRSSMQRVYALEVHKFFKCLRAQVKKIGSRGPFLLGGRDSPDGVFGGDVETKLGGTTPRGAWGSKSSVLTTPATSLAHTPRNRSSNYQTGHEKMLDIELPTATDDSLRLYTETSMRSNMMTPAESPRSTTMPSGVCKKTNTEIRPDLAFAMALEAVFCAVLHEEDTLRRCFGVADGKSVEPNGTANSTIPVATSEDSTLSSNAILAASGTDAIGLLNDSLVELFSGDSLPQFSSMLIDHPIPLQSSNEVFPDVSKRTTLTEDGVVSAVEVGVRNDSTTSTRVGQAPKRCYLEEQLVGFVKYCGEKCDRLYAVPMMVMINAYLREGTRASASSFGKMFLQSLKRVVTSIISRSIAEQTASIMACRKRYTVHPSGMLSCFTQLPAFMQLMEVVHNALPSAVSSRTEYASIALGLVDQSFEALNCIANLANPEAHGGVKLSKMENIARRLNKVFDGVDNKSIKQGFVQQCRHHAFFCAFYNSLEPTSYAADLLRERYESSRALRDRYEEVYLTRIVLVKNFPEFGTFALVAEDLAQVYSREELRHHSALSLDVVRRVVHCMPLEIRSGIPSSSKCMKKHFLRDVGGRKEEESFHCTLLQRMWQEFSTLLLQKIDFLEGLLGCPLYAGIKLTVTRSEVLSLLRAA